ncbi:hypothetical protein C8R46DRAFT_1030679 [Mycena filopes]|nr:hypothetical protein C8R46DRAFT_1030679 [Mycena filopes]
MPNLLIFVDTANVVTMAEFHSILLFLSSLNRIETQHRGAPHITFLDLDLQATDLQNATPVPVERITGWIGTTGRANPNLGSKFGNLDRTGGDVAVTLGLAVTLAFNLAFNWILPADCIRSPFLLAGDRSPVVAMRRGPVATKSPLPKWDMDPIRPAHAAMRAARPSNLAIRTPSLAVRVLQDQMPALYKSMTQHDLTLHREYNFIKCPDAKKCTTCDNFCDHVAELLEGLSDGDSQDSVDGEVDSEDSVDEEVDASIPCQRAVGKSSVDDALVLQQVRSFISVNSSLGELAGAAAASELADLKLKLNDALSDNQRLHQQLRDLERRLKDAPSNPRKRRASESTDAAVAPPPKRIETPASTGAFEPVLPSDLSNPNAVWQRLNGMAKPGPQASHLLLAQWLQHREVEVCRGIPLRQPLYAVDLRDARGHQEFFSRIPFKRHSSDPYPKRRRIRCTAALLRVLVVPRLYQETIQAHNIHIDPTPQLLPCEFPQFIEAIDALSTSSIAALLAARGVTAATADDTWQFCHNYIRALIGADDEPALNKAEWKKIVAVEENELKLRGVPPGLRNEAEDLYPRVVPGQHRPKGSTGNRKEGLAIRSAPYRNGGSTSPTLIQVLPVYGREKRLRLRSKLASCSKWWPVAYGGVNYVERADEKYFTFNIEQLSQLELNPSST